MSVHIVRHLSNPLTTVKAEMYDAEVTISVSGWLARDELVLERPYGVVEMRVDDGDRVAKGDVIAVVYPTEDDAYTSRQIRAIDSKLSELNYIKEHAVQKGDALETENRIFESLLSMLRADSAGKYGEYEEEALSFKALIYQKNYVLDGSLDVDELIEGLVAERSALASRLDNATGSVVAESAGIFFSETDGYEEILAVSTFLDIGKEEYASLVNAEKTQKDSLGKIAAGFEWSYAVQVGEADRNRFRQGSQHRLRFAGGDPAGIQATVIKVEPDSGGGALVVFRSSVHMPDIVGLRRARAEIAAESYRGLRVPKEALRFNAENEEGVYCLVLSQAVFKKVKRLEYQREGFYLVEYNPGENGALLPGDDIIVGAKELYDGKIY